MKSDKKNNPLKLTIIAGLLVLLAFTVAWKKSDHSFAGLWRTPDRQAQLLMDQGDYLEAADLFTHPMQRGEALFKAGEFKKALSAYNMVTTPEGIYNRGNTQMMMGKYDAAIGLYDQVLQQRTGWEAATTNREIAIAQKAAMAPPEDDAGGTGGQLEADEIVFDDRAKNKEAEEQVEGGPSEPMNDDEMRAMWLRKVQTKPADFLRAKFSYQHQRDEAKKGETK
jgi:Ca-activated chloride channel family protein